MADQANNTADAPRRRRFPGRGRGRGGRGGRGGRAPRSDAPAGADAAQPEVEPTQIFIAGFPEGTTAEQVQQFFAKHGDVQHVAVSARGVGNVTFATEAAVLSSLAENGQSYNDSVLRVERRRKRIARAPRVPRTNNNGAAAAAAPAAAVAPAVEVPKNPKKVFVGGLDDAIADEAVAAAFAAFGKFELTRSRNKRFAVLEFTSEADANKAVAGNVATIADVPVRVEPEDPNTSTRRRAARSAAAGGRGRGGRGRGRGGLRKPRRTPRGPVDPASLDPKRVFVGHLPENASEDQVRSTFKNVSAVELRGRFAYVTFASEGDATNALAQNNTTPFGGDAIRVEKATRPPRAAAAEPAEQ